MLNTAICINEYDLIREERHGISEGECPVDLMAYIQKEKAEGELIVFTLTSEAIRCMCAYDSLTEIRYFSIFIIFSFVFNYYKKYSGNLETYSIKY